ncbi:MAG: hypothetical protein IBX56_20265 [Methylomicrobium sp.]|nr:hypothetical protein [Methylomicrobium sp.]
MSVSNFLLDMATGAALIDGAKYTDCMNAARYWAKTRMGWEESDGDDYQAPTEIIIRSGGPVE